MVRPKSHFPLEDVCGIDVFIYEIRYISSCRNLAGTRPSFPSPGMLPTLARQAKLTIYTLLANLTTYE